MLNDTFDVHTLEKIFLGFEYKKTHQNKQFKTFEHEKLKTIVIAISGAYTKKQVISVVMVKMGINSYEKSCDIYKSYYPR